MILFKGVPLAAFSKRRPVFFEGGPGWKLENGAVVLKDGNPVYVQADGSEATIDIGTIGRLNGEAKALRLRAETAETKVKDFEGLDAKAARDALELVGKIDQKKLVDIGKIDEVRQQISTGFQTQLDATNAMVSDLKMRNANMTLAHAFGSSKFVTDKLAIPVDIVQATFGKHFTVGDDGKIGIKDGAGNVVYSKAKLGEAADFDEGLSIIVDGYANKDAILKGANQSGSGNRGGGGNNLPGVKSMTRTQWAGLGPADQAAYAREVGAGKATLTDA